MPILNSSDLQADLKNVKAADHVIAGSEPYPYLALAADDFERLGCALFDAEVGRKRLWDKATLMLRGSDAGRDVALFRDERLVGVVQCKRLEGSMALPAVFRELAKLVLFPFAEEDLPRIESGLDYRLMLARDPAGTVVAFFDQPQSWLSRKADDVAGAVREVLETYATLGTAFPDDQIAIAEVQRVLPLLNYNLLRPHTLNGMLESAPSIASQFFRQRVVVDNSVVTPKLEAIQELLLKVTAQTEGVQLLTDVDLRILKERIEGTPSSHRVNLGFAATFGLPHEMFVGEAALDVRGKRFVELAQAVSGDLNEWLHAQAWEKAEAIAADAAAYVPPFALLIPQAFFGLVVRDALQKQLANGKLEVVASAIFGFSPLGSDDERLADVHKTLMEQGRRAMAKDWSKLAGDPELIETKKEMFSKILASVGDEEELHRQLSFGVDYLKPKMIPIADELRRLGEQPITVVVTGLDALGSGDVLTRLFATFRAIDGLSPRPSPSASNGDTE